MNGRAIFGDQYGPLRGFCGRTAVPVANGGETMDALTATIIAVGGSLIVIVISQIQNRQPATISDSSAGSDSGVYAGGDDSGSHFFSWSDGGHGGSSPSTGFDSSGESDSGGGGGDGGGGGSD